MRNIYMRYLSVRYLISVFEHVAGFPVGQRLNVVWMLLILQVGIG